MTEKEASRDVNLALAAYWIGLFALAAYGFCQGDDIIDSEPVHDSPVRNADSSGVAFSLEPCALVVKPATPGDSSLGGFWHFGAGA